MTDLEVALVSVGAPLERGYPHFDLTNTNSWFLPACVKRKRKEHCEAHRVGPTADYMESQRQLKKYNVP